MHAHARKCDASPGCTVPRRVGSRRDMGERDVRRGDVPWVRLAALRPVGEPGATRQAAGTTVRGGRDAASGRSVVVACSTIVAAWHRATRPRQARRVVTRPALPGGECGRSASPRGAPAPTGDPSLFASDYRLVHGDAECLTSTPLLSRVPARHRTGHDEPRRRPHGRALAAELLDRLGSLGWCGAPAIQTNGSPPRHTSGGTQRDANSMHACNTIVSVRDVPVRGFPAPVPA
jgi:hypothetical protein